MPIDLSTPLELLRVIAARAKERRLGGNLTQQGLALRSGVSLGSIKRFERTGKIAFESLLKIALVLQCLAECAALFSPRALPEPRSLDALLKVQKTRQRGGRA